MKKLLLLSLALMLSLTELFAARMLPTRGRVVDEQGNAVAYATVVLLRDEKQVAGMASDEEGRFELRVPAGKYHLRIQYVGYEPIDRDVQLAADGELGNLTLRTAATQIEGVTVKAQLIRREADRFVVDVANTPSAIGRDGVELLEQAPGVWVSDDKISINGKSGSKVFINDRELRMEPEQLLTYLRSLRAEEIQKIEVVPVTGADYDADSSGGVIKITLRKRRENGLNGSVSMRTTQGKMGSSYDPAANISIHSGRFDINASAWASFGPSEVLSTEKTDYTVSNKQLNAQSEMKMDNTSGGGRLGAIYEINDRHSVGAELSYFRMKESGTTQTHSLMESGTVFETDSRFRPTSVVDGYEGTFNYIWKIDTLGSQFKVLGDYARREATSRNDNFSRMLSEGLPAVDSTYRDHTDNSFEVAALTLALDKKFSPKWSLQAGAKYTRNHTCNNSLYQYLKGEEWVRNDEQSLSIDYTEHIAAAYGIVTAKLGRWGITAGLRGEYTRTDGRRNGVEQNYFSLFPNANVSYALSRDGAYSLVAQYARTIRRPSFWTLMPNRSQISDYTYQTGNPDLLPSYTSDVSLTAVLAHKYTLTAGISIVDDEINQDMVPDAENPDVLGILWLNYDRTSSYYLSASLPFQLTKWWTLNLNANYIYHGRRLSSHGSIQYHHYLFANAQTTFTLPGKVYLDLSYRFSNRVYLGSCWVDAMHFLNASIKKSFFGDRLTCTFSAYNLLNRAQTLGARGDDFVRHQRIRQQWSNIRFRVGLTYNFKAGKAFQKKSIEAGAAEDRSRL